MQKDFVVYTQPPLGVVGLEALETVFGPVNANIIGLTLLVLQGDAVFALQKNPQRLS
jgi:hypothetical protein